MSIALDQISPTRGFFAFCDKCGEMLDQSLYTSAWTLTRRLRAAGWSRCGYNRRREVYLWQCTECRA